MSESEQISTSIEALGRRIRKRLGLPDSIAIGGIPATEGVAAWSGKGTDPGRSGGGVSWPLAEISREHHPEYSISTTDGIFTLTLKNVSVLTFTDGDGVEGQMTLADYQDA